TPTSPTRTPTAPRPGTGRRSTPRPARRPGASSRAPAWRSTTTTPASRSAATAPPTSGRSAACRRCATAAPDEHRPGRAHRRQRATDARPVPLLEPDHGPLLPDGDGRLAPASGGAVAADRRALRRVADDGRLDGRAAVAPSLRRRAHPARAPP